MAGKRENVVRVLTYLATDLESKGYGAAGILRQLAREVAQLEDVSGVGGCRCGAPIEQPGRGRPRKFCLSCSPRRNKPEKGSLSHNDERRSVA